MIQYMHFGQMVAPHSWGDVPFQLHLEHLTSTLPVRFTGFMQRLPHFDDLLHELIRLIGSQNRESLPAVGQGHRLEPHEPAEDQADFAPALGAPPVIGGELHDRLEPMI